jgi:hypothetical protein
MKTATATATKAKADTRLAEALNLVLADSYALMALTHLAHWNIEGPDFLSCTRPLSINTRICSRPLMKSPNACGRSKHTQSAV